MLLLKLILVPLFLLVLSIAGRRWGPTVAGWLAGLPVVAGPILFFIAMEQGALFAAAAAAAALSAVFASVAFSVAYSRAAQRRAWPASLAIALLAWAGAALCLSALPAQATLSLAAALLTLVAAPRLFAQAHANAGTHVIRSGELACRMLAGGLLTVGVTLAAGAFGPAWSGLLAVFPVLGIVLAVFSHRSEGPTFAATLLRGMATGLYSFVAFCFVLAVTLPYAGTAISFCTAAMASLVVQLASKRYLTRLSPAPALRSTVNPETTPR